MAPGQNSLHTALDIAGFYNEPIVKLLDRHVRIVGSVTEPRRAEPAAMAAQAWLGKVSPCAPASDVTLATVGADD